MQNEEWNVSAVSLSPELVRLAQQKQARFEACRQAAENGNEAAITELGINYFLGSTASRKTRMPHSTGSAGPRRRMRQAAAFSVRAM